MAPTPETVSAIVPMANEDPCDTNSSTKNHYTNNSFVKDEVNADNKSIESVNNTTQKSIKENASENLDFDDILPHIGEFGTYQKILFFLMIPFAFFVAFVYFSQIFITLVPEKHWCRIYELKHLPTEQRLVYLPISNMKIKMK